MNKITVDIHGPCVIRDAFELSEILKEKYQVNKFAQNNPINTINSSTLEEVTGIRIQAEDFAKTAPCWFKWFELNSKGALYNYFADNPSNYLLVSLTECLYPYYQFARHGKINKISISHGIITNKIAEKYSFPALFNPRLIRIEQFYNDIDAYMEKVTKIYTPPTL